MCGITGSIWTTPKLAIDPALLSNTTMVMRAHRWIEIPPGTLSAIIFFLRTSTGQVVDLLSLGASISFTLTIAPRD